MHVVRRKKVEMEDIPSDRKVEKASSDPVVAFRVRRLAGWEGQPRLFSLFRKMR
jgi:hypothetical protein